MAKAFLPEPSTQFPPLVTGDGLVIHRTLEGGGKTLAFDLTDWPSHVVVRRQIGEVAAQLVGPAGIWRQRATIDKARVGLRALCRWLESEQVNDLNELTTEHWAGWRGFVEARYAESTAHNLLQWSKLVLGDSARVKPSVRWAIRERVGHIKRPDTQPAYTAAEFDLLQRRSLQTLWQAHRRITRNHRLASMDDSTLPADVRHRQTVFRSILEGHVPEFSAEFPPIGAPDVEVVVGKRLTLHHLMFTAEEAMAAFVLLSCLEGANSSTLERLTLADETATSGNELPAITVHLDKPRRHHKRFFTNIWTGRSARAYQMIREATEPARTILSSRGVDTRLLILYSTHATNLRAADILGLHIMSGIPKARSAAKGSGARYSSAWLPTGVSVDFQKLHRTYQTVIKPAPTHNTRNTHTRAYLALSETQQRALGVVARRGFAAALDRAEETVSLRLSADQEASAEVHSGQLDTATVACRDIEHHPVTNTVCTDNFLMCLMCPNAIATKRHLPRLVLIHEVLTDLRSTLSQTAWSRWEADYLRLTAFLEREVRLTATQRQLALRKVADDDHNHVRALLNGTYDYE